MMQDKIAFDLMFLAEGPKNFGTNPNSAYSRGMRKLQRLGYAESYNDDDRLTWRITDAGTSALGEIPPELRAVFAGTKDV